MTPTKLHQDLMTVFIAGGRANVADLSTLTGASVEAIEHALGELVKAGHAARFLDGDVEVATWSGVVPDWIADGTE